MRRYRDGINFPEPNDAAYWDGATDQDIKAQGEALKATLPKPRSRLNEWYHNNQFLAWLLGISIGAVGTTLTFF